MRLRSAIARLRRRSEDGSMSVEFIMLAPVLGAVILVLVAAGRVSMAGNSVESAATAAAREASLSRSTAQAQANANQAAQISIAQAGLNCTELTVTINDSGLNVPLGEIGTVSADIACTLNMTDIALPGLPGSKTMTASAQSPVDAFRERP